MRGEPIGAVAARVCVWLLAGLIAGCGGGGGSSGGESSSAGTFSATFSPATLDTSTIQGTPGTVDYSAALTYTGSSTIYLSVDGDATIVDAVSGSIIGGTLSGTVTLRGDLTPGSYSTELFFLACFDQQCTKQVPGSPATLRVMYAVRSNIDVQQQVSLQRAGRDPAPAIVLPVTIPPEAGTVQVSSTGATDVIAVSFDGTSLHLSTLQVRAGQYTLQVVLQGSSDPRYVRTVTVTYTVSPPAGGEQRLSVNTSGISLFVPQGTTTTSQVLVVTRPTWTDAWDPPQIIGATGPMSLLDLGSNRYQLSFDASNVATGSYSGTIQFSAGATGGTVGVSATIDVVSSFYPSTNLNLTLTASSTPADLRLSSPVVTVDGVAAQWTATSITPWLTVLRNHGVTGVDTLDLQIDPTFAGATEWDLVGMLDLSIDRPGTLPLPVQVSVENFLPQLQRSVAVLSGTGGRIYVEGAINSIYSGLLSSGALHVTGANLASAQIRLDTRFVGDVTELALDVNGAVAGQPITISALTPLASSQVTIAVKTPPRVSPGYVSLPYGAYRPSGYAPGMDAFYFSAPDTVYRWAKAGNGWTLSQAAVPGVTGIAVRPDEQRMYAVAGDTLRALDPINLTQVATGQLLDYFGQPTLQFDAAAAAGLASFTFASDGRAIASLVIQQSGQPLARGAYWVTSSSRTREVADLAFEPTTGDPGTGYWSNNQLQGGVGLIASANRHAVVGTDAGGAVSIYQPTQATWLPGPIVPAGISIVAISDDGRRMVRSDGVVLESGSDLGNLASVVPFTHSVGGYGLTQDGRYGLVYGYQIVIESGSQRARNATLWAIDLSQVPTTPLALAPVVAAVILPDAVGCTAAVLASGETCLHTASVTLVPGSTSAFVLGSRGLAAVPLPSSLLVTSAAGVRVMADRRARSTWASSARPRPLGVLQP